MLTPIDIQNHSLKTAVRGYSKKETDDFIEEIIKSYEEIYRENRELKDKLSSLSDGIQYYKGMESTLQKALVLAEKTSSETQEAAKSKAEALLSESETKAEALTNEAETKAEAMVKEAKTNAEAIEKEANAFAEVTKAKAKQELEETRTHVRKLVQSYENYRLQFKKLAESQIEMLDSEHYSIFAPELEEMLGDAPNADEAMEADETVAINSGISSRKNKEETSEDNAIQAEEESIAADSTDEEEVQNIAEENETASVSTDSLHINDNISDSEEQAAVVETATEELDYSKEEHNTDVDEQAATEEQHSSTEEHSAARVEHTAINEAETKKIAEDSIAQIGGRETSGSSDDAKENQSENVLPVSEHELTGNDCPPPSPFRADAAMADDIKMVEPQKDFNKQESPFVFIDTE